MRAQTMRWHFHRPPLPTAPLAGTTAPPSHARRALPTFRLLAYDLPARVLKSQFAAGPTALLRFFPGAVDLPAHFHRYQSPASCSTAPAVDRTVLSAPRRGWHIVRASCRSDWPAWHPTPPLAARITLRATALPALLYLTTERGQRPSAGHCH